MNRPSRNFLPNKKQEWEKYRSEVTAFELKNLLPVL
ncbi:glutamine synthetase [Streptomyces californicus]